MVVDRWWLHSSLPLPSAPSLQVLLLSSHVSQDSSNGRKHLTHPHVPVPAHGQPLKKPHFPPCLSLLHVSLGFLSTLKFLQREAIRKILDGHVRSASLWTARFSSFILAQASRRAASCYTTVSSGTLSTTLGTRATLESRSLNVHKACPLYLLCLLRSKAHHRLTFQTRLCTQRPQHTDKVRHCIFLFSCRKAPDKGVDFYRVSSPPYGTPRALGRQQWYEGLVTHETPPISLFHCVATNSRP